MQSELKELRLHVKMLKEGENAELKKLKEVILRQEGTINALKRDKGDGSEGEGGAILNPMRTSKNSNARQAGLTVRAQELRNSKDTLPPRSKSKVPLGRISIHVQGSSKETQSEEVAKSPVPVDEIMCGSTEEVEEPTEHWLQRHLSKPTDENNNLGHKMTDGRQKNDPYFVFNAIDSSVNQQCEQQRKPYNAVNYSGTNHDGGVNHRSNPSVPLFVTSAVPTLSRDITKQSSEERLGAQSTKSQITTYNNGTQKEVSVDGTTTISFANGDRKRTYANEKKGVIVYYYASTKVSCIVFCAELVFDELGFMLIYSCPLLPTDHPGDSSRRNANVSFSEQASRKPSHRWK